MQVPSGLPFLVPTTAKENSSRSPSPPAADRPPSPSVVAGPASSPPELPQAATPMTSASAVAMARLDRDTVPPVVVTSVVHRVPTALAAKGDTSVRYRPDSTAARRLPA